jgi:hypothetical protein
VVVFGVAATGVGVGVAAGAAAVCTVGRTAC